MRLRCMRRVRVSVCIGGSEGSLNLSQLREQPNHEIWTDAKKADDKEEFVDKAECHKKIRGGCAARDPRKNCESAKASEEHPSAYTAESSHKRMM